MSKALVSLLFVTLCVALVQGAYEKVCPPDTRQCSASASLRISISGPGHCVASGASYCKAFATDFGDCFDSSVIYSQSKKCIEGTIETTAGCYVKSLAAVLTAAYAKADCEGKHAKGCVTTDAEGKAFACSTAKAFIDMKIEVGDRRNTAECDAELDATINAIAEASASSFAKACSAGKPSVDFDIDADKQITNACVKLFAKCFVFCDDEVAKTHVVGGGSADTKTTQG